MKTNILLLFSFLFFSANAFAGCPDGFKPTDYPGLCYNEGADAFVYLDDPDTNTYLVATVKTNEDGSVEVTRQRSTGDGPPQAETVTLAAPGGAQGATEIVYFENILSSKADSITACKQLGKPKDNENPTNGFTSNDERDPSKNECIDCKPDTTQTIRICYSKTSNREELDRIAAARPVTTPGPQLDACKAKNSNSVAYQIQSGETTCFNEDGQPIDSVTSAEVSATQEAMATAEAQRVEREANGKVADVQKFLEQVQNEMKTGDKSFLSGLASGMKLKTSSQILASPNSLMGYCEQLLDIPWSQVANAVEAGQGRDSIAKMFDTAYVNVFKKLQNRLENISKSNEEDGFGKKNINTSISINLTEAKNTFKDIQLCTAMAFMTSKVDYDDADALSAEEGASKKTSFDGKIVAKRFGAETQDFPACSKAINVYNGLFIGKQAMNIGQQFQFQEAAMDAKDTALQNQNDITSGMKAQQEMVDEQKKIMDARTAFEGAKGATLWGFYQGIPTRESIVNECKGSMGEESGGAVAPVGQDTFNNYVAIVIKSAQDNISDKISSRPGEVDTSAVGESGTRRNFNLPTGEDQTDSTASTISGQSCDANEETICAPAVTDITNEKVCTNAANNKRRPTALVLNEVKCKQALFKAMTDAGVEMATNMLKSKLLDDQSDKIGDAIANVKSFDEDNPAPQFEELNTDICQVDPAAPECAGVDPVFDRGRGFSGNGINVSGFQRAGTNTSLGTQADREFDTGEDSEKEGRGKGVNGIGTTIGAPTNSTAFTDNIPGAAGMKKGGGGAGGGGGGGGGVGAAASSGGGGGGVGGGGGSRSFSGSNGKRVSFSGSGKGSLSFGGGRGGRGKRSGKKAGNPFSKFFKNKKGKKGKTLNFRGVASVGKKKDSLFGMISSRYNAVSKERLLQYKKEEANK